MVNLALLNWDYVISIVISFSIAASFMILYNRGRQLYSSKEDDKERITEAIVSEYSRRLKHIEDLVVRLGIRIDNLELREDYNTIQLSKKPSDINAKHHTNYNASHEMSQVEQAYVTPVQQQEYTSPVVQRLTSTDAQTSLEDVQSGTMEYILKLLNERPRSSREIQFSIGRTREHTSRLMKRLYELRLVDRQSNSRPYKYTITHAGRVRINLPSSKNSDSGNENTSHIIDVHSRQQRNNSEF
ncbi:MAG TPA: winged helix-turn-helix domain-containing protein [Nitrososphaeraceae archaeon]|nr:winged helix-turn-helix domain-containing protein [Nitrososphaeraceae archaeon]